MFFNVFWYQLRRHNWKNAKSEVSSFLSDRTNGRAIGTVLRLSVCLSSVCDVMSSYVYCG